MKHLKTSISFLLFLFQITVKADFHSDSLAAKVSHAEPLYTDLIRDLGTRKGEREFNFGTELIRSNSAIAYGLLLEYEFAPVNRLGLEIEVPCLISRRTGSNKTETTYQMEGLKLSGQYSFYVSPKRQMSLATAYTHEFIRSEKTYGIGSFPKLLSLPQTILIAAKRSGDFHSMLYLASALRQKPEWLFNLSLHYMVPGSSHFIGFELKHEISEGNHFTEVLPQIRLKTGKRLLLGLVSKIPLRKSDCGPSSFMRLIWNM